MLGVLGRSPLSVWQAARAQHEAQQQAQLLANRAAGQQQTASLQGQLLALRAQLGQGEFQPQPAWGQPPPAQGGGAGGAGPNPVLQRQQVRSRVSAATGSGSLAASGKVWAALEQIKVEPAYAGVHVAWPLRLDNVLDVLEGFKRGRGLHYKYTLMLLTALRKVLANEPNICAVHVPAGTTVTVCGDTHGQLQDLFTIFHINGLPDRTNRYLFNGDFVDRGKFGVEVFLALACFKILYPDAFFMNRGNHEARAQNCWMGFEEEVHYKYKRAPPGRRPQAGAKRARRVYDAFGAAFDALPLCCLIERKVFVLHGGLFRNEGVTLRQIGAVKRRREPPLEGTSFEDRVYEDILWSDPRPTACYPQPLSGRQRSGRGAGCEFGRDVTMKFCADNRLALIIRSHECVSEGYEVLHDGRLLTIFSASRYCGTQTNKGAFVKFGPDLQPEIQQFFAHAMDDTAFGLTEAQRQANLERDTLHMIIERIMDKKADLYWYYTHVGDPAEGAAAVDRAPPALLGGGGGGGGEGAMDTDAGAGAGGGAGGDERPKPKWAPGTVSRLQWAQGLTTVLNLGLPFLHFQPRLAMLDGDGRINYTRFLERYKIEMKEGDTSWQDAVVQSVCEKLYDMCANVTEVYHRFDANHDGFIEYEARRSSAEHLSATKAPRCTATAWIPHCR